MGYNSAQSLTDTDLTLKTQLAIHFSSNCYPPVPYFMLDVAIEAINAYNDFDGGKVISLPAHVTFKGSNQVTAFEVIETLRLEAFLNNTEE